MNAQVRAAEAVEQVLGEVARQALAGRPLGSREGDAGFGPDFAAGVVHAARLAVVVRDADQTGNVDHGAVQRRVQRIRVNRDEDDLTRFGAGPALLPVDRVRQVPPEVRRHRRVVDAVGGVREHDVSAGTRQHVGVLDPERCAFPRGRHDGGGRAALQQPLRAQHDVVDVHAFPQPADRRSGVAAAVAGVEDHRDPVEIEGHQLVLDLPGGGALLFPLLAARMIGWQVAGREQVERDLDLVADRQVADIADRVAFPDPLGQFVHVVG